MKLGKLLALPIRLVNVPFRVPEILVDSALGIKDSERGVSAPLEALARAIEEATE